MKFLLILCLCLMADKAPLVIEAGQVRQAAAGDVIVCPGIKDSALTASRVVLVGVGGILEDNADLTFDGTTLKSKCFDLPNTTDSSTGIIKQDTYSLIHSFNPAGADGLNLFIGDRAGNFTMGIAGGSSSRASRNLGIGRQALKSLTTGNQNVAIGVFAGDNLTTGNENMCFGYSSLGLCASGLGNVGIGVASLGSVTGSFNIGIGYYAGYRVTGNGSICIGKQAGYWETGSGKLFLDNAPRTNEADARVKALVYGVFAAAPVNQDLVFNAQVGINIPPTAWLTLPAGSAAAGAAPLKMTSGTLLTTPEAGAIEYDGTRFHITGAESRRVVSRASDSITSATAVVNTTTETTVFTAPVPADTIAAGKVYTVFGCGKISTHDASDTLTIRVKVAGITLISLVSTPKTVTDAPMHCRLTCTARTIGPTGTFASYGEVLIECTCTHANISSSVVNTTIANDITITFQWSNANAGNSATIDQGFLKLNN